MSASVFAFQLQDSVFREDEVIIATISEQGIQNNDLQLLDWNDTDYPVGYLIREIRDFSIVIFDAPIPGDYTLFYDNTSLAFTVEEGEGLECLPQYGYLEDGDSFDIQLRYSDITVSVEAEDVSPIRNSIDVVGSATLEVNYDLETLNEDTTIKFTYGNRTYTYLIFLAEIDENVVEPEEEPEVSGELEFLQDFINQSVTSDTKLQSYIPFKNDVSVDLAAINFYVTGDIASITELQYSTLDYLASGDSDDILVVVNKDRDVESGKYSGELVMESGEFRDVLPIHIEFTEIIEPKVDEEIIFPDVELVDEPVINVPPEEEDKVDNRSLYVGIAILVVLVILLIYFWIKLRNKPTKSFEDVIDERK